MIKICVIFFSFIVLSINSSFGQKQPFVKTYETKNGVSFIVKEFPEDGSHCSSDVLLQSVGAKKDINIVLESGDFILADSTGKKQIFIYDLNKDGYDEIYITKTTCGSGAFDVLIAFTTNKNREVVKINCSSFSGEDRVFFNIKGNYIVKNTPIYLKTDPHCCPSGGKKIEKYALEFINGEYVFKVKESTIVND